MARPSDVPLGAADRECIRALAENGMRPGSAAKALYMHRNTMVYHINRIKRATGLDPRCFYDLVKLVEMANE